jgi:hypothetical protein
VFLTLFDSGNFFRRKCKPKLRGWSRNFPQFSPYLPNRGDSSRSNGEAYTLAPVDKLLIGDEAEVGFATWFHQGATSGGFVEARQPSGCSLTLEASGLGKSAMATRLTAHHDGQALMHGSTTHKEPESTCVRIQPFQLLPFTPPVNHSCIETQVVLHVAAIGGQHIERRHPNCQSGT